MLRSIACAEWRVDMCSLRQARPSSCAARRTAAMMLMYPVQRQRLPESIVADAVVGEIERLAARRSGRACS